IAGLETRASAVAGRNRPPTTPIAAESGEAFGPVPGPRALPLVLRKSARRFESSTPAGIRSEILTHRPPPVQYRGDVRRSASHSGDPRSGRASWSSSTDAGRPDPVFTVARRAPPSHWRQARATIVDQNGAQTESGAVRARPTVRSVVPAALMGLGLRSSPRTVTGMSPVLATVGV